MADSTQRVEAWSQFAAVILVLLGCLWFAANRFGQIQQWEIDADTQRQQMESTINRIDQRLDTALDRSK